MTAAAIATTATVEAATITNPVYPTARQTLRGKTRALSFGSRTYRPSRTPTAWIGLVQADSPPLQTRTIQSEPIAALSVDAHARRRGFYLRLVPGERRPLRPRPTRRTPRISRQPAL